MTFHICIVIKLVLLLILGATADKYNYKLIWTKPSDYEAIPYRRFQFGSGQLFGSGDLADIGRKCTSRGCPQKNPGSPKLNPYYPPKKQNPYYTPKKFIPIVPWQEHCKEFGKRDRNKNFARPGEIPYIVSIRRKDKHVCTGTIINKRYILTSAICVHGMENVPHTIKYGVTNLQESCKIIPVAKIIKHEHFGETRYNDNDVALLQLVMDMDLNSHTAAAVKLPAHPCPTNVNVLVAGWEALENSVPSNNLLKYFARIKPENICSRFFAGYNPKYHMCAGDFPCCQAEFGDPLIVDGVQYGLGSWLPRYHEFNTKPWVFTRLANYVPWILQHSCL